jgi:hypothetical protein
LETQLQIPICLVAVEAMVRPCVAYEQADLALRTVVPTTQDLPRGARFSLAIFAAEKWDEQVSWIGETIGHEKAIATPHRGSSTQRRQG